MHWSISIIVAMFLLGPLLNFPHMVSLLAFSKGRHKWCSHWIRTKIRPWLEQEWLCPELYPMHLPSPPSPLWWQYTLTSLAVMLCHSAAAGLGEQPQSHAAVRDFCPISYASSSAVAHGKAALHCGPTQSSSPHAEPWPVTRSGEVLQQARHQTLLPASLVAAPGPADCN